MLSAGQDHDLTCAEPLIEEVFPGALIADKAFAGRSPSRPKLIDAPSLAPENRRSDVDPPVPNAGTFVVSLRRTLDALPFQLG